MIARRDRPPALGYIVRRMIRRHRAETGLIVAGRLGSFRYSLDGRWESVIVRVDDRAVGVLRRTDSRHARWVPHEPGRVKLDLINAHDEHFARLLVEVPAQGQVLVRFAAPRFPMFRRHASGRVFQARAIDT
jgi:hypothetical protein